MHILALDVGDKKIGVAIGDTETRLAFARPPVLVESWEEAWAPLQALVKAEQVATVIVGWPMNSDGSLGPQTQRVQEFIEQWAVHIGLPVVKRDERRTSLAVQREQQTAGRKLRRGQEDSLAAQLLLETYFMEKP